MIVIEFVAKLLGVVLLDWVLGGAFIGARYAGAWLLHFAGRIKKIFLPSAKTYSFR
ncbi:hypothetical protein [Mucilaginibacter hurinus]|uniref:hypothetical protein n=1 Tax=Mucilaginibacter hurinus TaxID=2201324 RepID=UPI001314E68F|nr:hypothetical protein [Mucilaginibacter hurinus]